MEEIIIQLERIANALSGINLTLAIIMMVLMLKDMSGRAELKDIKEVLKKNSKNERKL